MIEEKNEKTHQEGSTVESSVNPAVNESADIVDTVSDDEDVKVTKPRKRKNLEIEKLKEDLSGTNERFLRLRAEYDNYRKRTEKEKQASISHGIITAVEGLLPVLDTLSNAAAAECSDPEYKKGIDLTITKFEDSLKKLGITEIDAQDQPFDPIVHNAVSREAREGVESGIIIRVLQKGYMLGERVVRHSMVTVAE